MRYRIPPMIVLMAALIVVGVACGDDAATVDPEVAERVPMSIVATTTTGASTGPSTTGDTSSTTTTATEVDAASIRSSTVDWRVGDRTPPIASTLNRPATTTTAAGEGVSTRSSAVDWRVGDRTPPIASTLNRPATTTTTKAPAAGQESLQEEKAVPAQSDPEPAANQQTGWWRPELQEEAFLAIDPRSSGADLWYENTEDIGVVPHRFYRFYYMEGGDTQTELWRLWLRTLDVFWSTGIIYYPVRYDLSWHDHPDTAKVVATWPLGEQRELLVTDGEPLPAIDLPSGPPLPPTTPYAEPQFPEAATRLGRDCPPVEQLWLRDAPVTDPCTLSAVRTAFQFAYAAATPEQTQAAVRDGHVLAETVRRIEEITNQDSFRAYWFDPANPGHYVAEVRNVRWAGRFAGASRISAEFRIYARPGLAVPQMQVLARAKIQEQVQAGLDIPDWALGDELPTGPPPPDYGFWDEMMLVRTADGTWRMSFPMWCFSVERKIGYESASCPEDPNPVWSDWVWDFDLYPPNNLGFWLNATVEQRKNRGVPPS